MSAPLSVVVLPGDAVGSPKLGQAQGRIQKQRRGVFMCVAYVSAHRTICPDACQAQNTASPVPQTGGANDNSARIGTQQRRAA